MDKNTAKKLILEYQNMVSSVPVLKRDFKMDVNKNYVLVGLRRAGKSFLMYQTIQELLRAGHSKEEILFFNFEDDRATDLTLQELDIIKVAYEELFDYKPIFFLDEIQVVDGWERFARRLADTGYRVFITGSNAKMLSREIATTLGGRYMMQEVFPYSFDEYLRAVGVEIHRHWELTNPPEIMRNFETFFRYGGLPEAAVTENVMKRSWLSNLFNKIYFGDLLSRHDIRNNLSVKVLVRKLAESVKQPISYNRAAGLVSTVAGKVKNETVIDYMSYLEESWLIFPIENYASKLADKVSNKKYYFTDNGILNLFLLDPATSLLENLVAVELRRRFPGDVYFYHNGCEVDFLLPERRTAIQASYSISEAETRAREVEGLVKLNKVFPLQRALIVTKDQEGAIEEGGLRIEYIPLPKWLLLQSTHSDK